MTNRSQTACRPSLVPLCVLVAAFGCGCGTGVDAADSATALSATSRPLVRITGASVVGDCGTNDFFGSNFDDAEVEMMAAVNPAHRQDIVVTWFQDASVTYASAVSRNRGQSWETEPVPGISACDGGDAEGAADSWLSIGPDGTVYLAGFSVFLDLGENPGLPTRTTLNVSRGTLPQGGGISWSDKTVVQSGAVVFHDRPIITADPRKAGTAYLLWNDGTQVPPFPDQPLMFSRTDDGGMTWSAPALVNLPTAGVSHEGRVHALPDGSLLATFVIVRTNPLTHQVLAKRSTDGGRSWSLLPTIIAEIPAGAVVGGGGDCRTVYAPIRDAERQDCVVMPEFSLSGADGSDGTAYVAWRQDVGEGDTQVRVAKSVDGGRSWTAPVSVSAAHGQKGLPTIAVADDGTLGVSWYDFRSDVAGDAPFSAEVRFARSADGGRSWREEQVAGPFDMRTAPMRLVGGTGLFLGDYQGLVALDDGFGAVFALPAPYAVTGSTDLFFAHLAAH